MGGGVMQNRPGSSGSGGGPPNLSNAAINKRTRSPSPTPPHGHYYNKGGMGGGGPGAGGGGGPGPGQPYPHAPSEYPPSIDPMSTRLIGSLVAFAEIEEGRRGGDVGRAVLWNSEYPRKGQTGTQLLIVFSFCLQSPPTSTRPQCPVPCSISRRRCPRIPRWTLRGVVVVILRTSSPTPRFLRSTCAPTTWTWLTWQRQQRPARSRRKI